MLPGSQVASIKEETPDVKTFGFNAPKRPDRGPFCEAGQFASFDLPGPNGETLNRTWTISSPPGEIAETGRFTISVKKVGHCLYFTISSPCCVLAMVRGNQLHPKRNLIDCFGGRILIISKSVNFEVASLM